MTGPFRSKKVRDHSRGQMCSLRLPGICNGNPETTVYAHIRDKWKGIGQKASDSSGVFACSDCHRAIDEHLSGHGENPMTHWHIIRAMQETLEILITDGIIGFPHDPEPKPTKPKPRKAKAYRAPIKSRGFGEQSRPIPSRPFPSKP